MAASLTTSPFMMSVSQFYLLAVWLFMGEPVKTKLKTFWSSKIAVVIVSLYLLHLLGLAWSSDFQYAFKDLRVKLPILVLPLVMSSMRPLSKRHFDLLMLFYVLSVFVATCITFAVYLRHQYTDVREISIFISHIRFCLHIVLSIGIILYYIFTRHARWWSYLVQGLLIAWFCYQLLIFESLSGYAALAGMLFVSLLYVLFKRIHSKGLRLAAVVILLAIPLSAGCYLYRLASKMLTIEPVELSKLEKKTALGNDYWHDTVCFSVENGRYVGLYFCRPEMREAWNERSGLDYDGLTMNGENLEATLARYLTSKELRKDREGVMALTDEDIHNVESGVANYESWSHPGLYSRLSQTLFEYQQYRRLNNPNGGSLSQRLEYTRASLHLIRQHPVFGVGTGDIPMAYQRAYDELNSPLEAQFRHKAHNQYLSITVGFGLIGLVLFLFILLFPFCAEKRNRTYLYSIFLAILLISMFPEDTIETQAGVTFYAFFNSLFIFAFSKQDKKESIS